MRRLLVFWALLSACASTSMTSDAPADPDIESPSSESTTVSEVSRENTNPPKYPAIVDCAQEHGSVHWADVAFRDFVVTIQYTTLPFAVDVDPGTGIDADGFEFCVREAIRSGDVPVKASSMLATGFRLYAQGGATSIPMVQGGLDPDTFRNVFSPDLHQKPNPNRELNGCVASHGKHPFAGAVLLGARILDQRAIDVEIVASTLRQPEVLECMLDRMKSVEIPLEGGPYEIRYPMSFRTL